MSEIEVYRAAYEAANPFTSPTRSLFDSLLSRRRLEAARVEEWKCGRCCGDRGLHGLCQSIGVRFARAAAMESRGMGRAARNSLSQVCDWSEERELVEAAYEISKELGIKLAPLVGATTQGESHGDGD